jgi:hypothetical protein
MPLRLVDPTELVIIDAMWDPSVGARCAIQTWISAGIHQMHHRVALLPTMAGSAGQALVQTRPAVCRWGTAYLRP